MRKLLLAFCLLFSISALKSQVDTLFIEDFNTPNWQLTKSSIPSNSSVLFFHDTVLSNRTAGGSATDTVGNRTTSYLTSPKLPVKDSLGALYPSYRLYFDQICYIDWFDQASVEFSFAALNWTKLPSVIIHNGMQEQVYTGPSVYFPQRYFSKLSSALWPNMDSMFTFPPSTNAWVLESFELRPVIDEYIRNNMGIIPDSIRIRFGLFDDPTTPVGRSGLHQWWIDNVAVIAGPMTVGVQELSSERLKIFPNPVEEFIWFEGIEPSPSLTYRIYSVNGKLLREGSPVNRPIQVDFLENGVYLLQLQNGEENITKKFIKQ